MEENLLDLLDHQLHYQVLMMIMQLLNFLLEKQEKLSELVKQL